MSDNAFASSTTRTICPSYVAAIYIAGSYEHALEAVRSWCSKQGDCWTVAPCDYVYTGGQESGVVVTRINYPRFPFSSPVELQVKAIAMAEHLKVALHQTTCTIVGPERTAMISRHKSGDEVNEQEQPRGNTIEVDDAEHATILAALRYYQRCGQGDPARRADSIHEIATNGDRVISLDAEAIDVLCERIN